MLPGVGEGRREANKARTRRDIERAALRLFAEQGFDAVTVEDVAALARVSPSTVYRYYGTKDAMLYAPERNLLAQLSERLRATWPGQVTFDHLAAALLEVTATLDDDLEGMVARARIAETSERLVDGALLVQRRWEEQIAATLDELDRGRNPLRTKVLSATALAAFRVALRECTEMEKPSGLTELVGAALGHARDT
jgi:TetR/AcrR family transcriptional regulator, regulator of mycofactocin system